MKVGKSNKHKLHIFYNLVYTIIGGQEIVKTQSTSMGPEQFYYTEPNDD